ncbi:preprotein translocase subunit SecA [Mollicutes bacterium LVI A0078]|nr:preprotein translocase subunit SecA [Mollicutes bacterium LVI A0075]WOO90777.1 preprotein translocase subunit SecA [Mollicutes bacterium LVI A0078]
MKKIKSLFDIDKQYLKKYDSISDQVISLEEDFKKLSDEQLQAKTAEFKTRIGNGESKESLKVEILATVREAATRALGMTPFKVQIMGALTLIDNNIAEMKTGEGKTLMSTLAVYYMALDERGVYVVTVNDYLARRDATEMGVLYNYLGLTVGYSDRELSKEEKREAYHKDVTYVTNNELGFDYLRDNMAFKYEERVLGELAYAVVDEVDSILIDEARTPLIISGQEKKVLEVYSQVDAVVKNLKEDEDYIIDLKDKLANLTNAGIDKIEKSLVRGNLFDLQNSQMLHAINQSLKANYCMHNEIDYVVRDGKVVIVDSFTGRLMEGRVFSDGLHQALEAKEHVETQKQTRTLATITFQNFFRLFDNLSGMTGTAKTEEEEFQKTYGLDVICIPTNVPVIRLDREDTIFVKENDKYEFMIKLIKERHNVGQPILIGTVAIETSERIAEILKKAGIKATVLNAKNNAEEALIVENAGQLGAITIATNMAGRGTDIKIAADVKALPKFTSEISKDEINPAGLLIIGTERHESRRIDDQLRGRSGRQGDAGESAFFVSFEDDLMRRYISPMIKLVLDNGGFGDQAISDKRLTKAVAATQKRVESVNYESRKTVLKYDDVMREQREVVYGQRDYILTNESILEDVKAIITDYVSNILDYYETTKDEEILRSEIESTITKYIDFDLDGDIKAKLLAKVDEELENKLAIMGQEDFDAFLKTVCLKIFDENWISHIDEMQVLRQSIGLRGYGQVDPLHEYQREGRRMFEEMLGTVERDMIKYILLSKINTNSDREASMNKLAASHSHTVGGEYKTIVNDEKIGRNDLCPCGSGKKYKDCHGK